jgi:alkylation response protein AidB-like acyl-CoA dehydrogenase
VSAVRQEAAGLPRDHLLDEHRWFREGVADFVARHLRPHGERFRSAHGFDRDVWLEAGRRGLLGLGIPEHYGGAATDETDFRLNQVLAEELAAEGLAYASCFGIHTDVVAPYLVELTTPEQRERWLPGCCTGEIVTAIGMTEPQAGSDLAGLRTTAERHGGAWTLNGSKTFITNGASADLVVVAARTGKARHQISLFAIEGDMGGFTRGRPLAKVGQHESDTAELFFEDVAVPAENLIGEEDRGFACMMDRLAQERLSAACANVAHARAGLALTFEHARDRRAFGRPIGAFQANRFLLAELSTELDVTQAYVDRCVMAHVSGRLGAVDAAKAKWWSAEVQNRVLDACVQLHGGYGYMEEYAVARAWADARVTKIWAGSNEIMKEIVGRALGFGDPPRPTTGDSSP